MTENSILQAFIPIVEGLALALGQDYEIVLHDVSTPEHSILALKNGHVTGRTLDSPLRDYALYLLRTGEKRQEDYVSNFLTRGRDGRKIRSNTLYIRDENRLIIGFLCINHDMTKALMLQGMVEQLTGVSGDATRYSEFGLDKDFSEGVLRSAELLERNLEVLRRRVNTPLHLGSKQEKLRAIEELEEEGFFLLKGAVEAFAQETGNSVFTIYRYLREVRDKDPKKG